MRHSQAQASRTKSARAEGSNTEVDVGRALILGDACKPKLNPGWAQAVPSWPGIVDNSDASSHGWFDGSIVVVEVSAHIRAVRGMARCDADGAMIAADGDRDRPEFTQHEA